MRFHITPGKSRELASRGHSLTVSVVDDTLLVTVTDVMRSRETRKYFDVEAVRSSALDSVSAAIHRMSEEIAT